MRFFPLLFLTAGGCITATNVPQPEVEDAWVVDAQAPDAQAPDADFRAPDARVRDEIVDAAPLDVAAPDVAIDFELPDAETPDVALDLEVLDVAIDAEIPDAAIDAVPPAMGPCKLVLVLDYSGSMAIGFGEGTRIDALQRAVNGLLDQNLPIDYGMVMFSSDVLATVAIGPDAPVAMRAAIQQPADGNTNYSAALEATQGLFDAADAFGRNVLFISDGAPSTGGDPYPGLVGLWEMGITSFTLNIGGGGAQADLLRDMSGNREHPRDETFYFEARDEQQLFDAFAAVADRCTPT